MNIDIVIPSAGRADRVKTFDAVANCKICVPEKEAKKYAEYNPNVEIITHPDSLKGLTLKRQFIIERFPNVLMVDDDVVSFRRCYEEDAEASKVDKDEAYDIIQYVGNVAHLAGAYLF